jgi:hypothetical protein
MESPYYMWSNQHVQRSPFLIPRGDAGSGSGRRSCTPERLSGVELSTWGSTMAGYEQLNSVITLVQVRSHGMAEVANGGHVTVRIAVGVGQC